jgi:hypothetical protein
MFLSRGVAEMTEESLAHASSHHADMRRFNALVSPGQIQQFPTLGADFYLTDVVLDLWSFPEGLDSKASCGIWLVTPASSSEVLFQCFVDRHGHQVHLVSGVHCPSGSYLTVNAGIFAVGPTADLRVLLSGQDA